MLTCSLLHRLRHVVLTGTLVVLMAACGTKDQRPLVVVDVPLGAYAGVAATVQISVTLTSGESAQKLVTVTPGYTSKLGVYLPSGASGTGTVTVTLLDATNCPLASAAVPITVAAGEITTAGALTWTAATGVCGTIADAGLVLDASPSVDAGGTDSSGLDGGVGADVLVRPVDGAAPGLDAQPNYDGGVADLPMVSDAPMADLPVADAYVAPDLGPDSTPDAPPTTMQLFARCQSYTHSKLTSTGQPGDWVVRAVLFSADGKHLVSLADDGRAKVWDIGASGLSVNASGLEFAGSGKMNGVFSADGKLLAIGSHDGVVKIYDFDKSLSAGAAVAVAELSPDALPYTSSHALPRGFTTDGKQLVVAYEYYYFADPNQIAVWDLSTQQIVRTADTNSGDDWPWTFLPAAYTSPLWVVTAEAFTGDGGGYQSTVTLLDVSQSPAGKVQFIVNGDVYRAAFSPDGTTLALAMDTGEVSLWDITNKAKITQLGSPLVTGSTSSSAEALALAYSPDGKYVAAGFGFTTTPSVRLFMLQPKQSLQKTVDYDPFSLAFSPDGLALAIGEYGLGAIQFCTP
jgi:WD40 repeat protein